MAGSMNKVLLIGRLGGDPEARNFQNGSGVVNFTLATSERWRDQQSGEQRERTEWHRIAIFPEGLRDVAMKHLKKGDLVSIEGKLETRKWTDQQNVDHYSTEIVIRAFQGGFIMLGSPSGNGASGSSNSPGARPRRDVADAGAGRDIDDDIPF